jgi:hypothetical protein
MKQEFTGSFETKTVNVEGDVGMTMLLTPERGNTECLKGGTGK